MGCPKGIRIYGDADGQYLKVQVTGGAHTVYLGPLTHTFIPSESLSNIGPRYRHGDFNEKPCQHQYTTGFIRYTSSRPAGYTDAFIGSFDSETFSEVVGFGMLRYLYEADVKVEEEKSTVTVTVMSRYSIPNGYPLAGGTVVIRGKRIVSKTDQRNVRYSDFLIVSSSYTGLPGISTVGVVGSPYGSVNDLTWTDAMLEAFHKLWGDLQMEVELGHRPDEPIGSEGTLRDRAIFNAIDDLDVEGLNLLENVKDLATLKDLLDPLKDIAHCRKDPISILRLLANLHLWWKYVIKTGILDLKAIRDLIKWLRTHSHELSNALAGLLMIGRGTASKVVDGKFGPGSEYELRYDAKLVYGPDTSSFNGWRLTLEALGFVPNVSDLWDLVPWSFVFDWFIPIGEAIDNTNDMMVVQRLPLIYCIITRRASAKVNLSLAHSSGTYEINLKSRSYDRTVATRLPKDMWLGLTWKDPRKQLLTGSALLIQWITGKKVPKHHLH